MKRLALFLALLCAPACSHSSRADSIHAALVAVDAARDGLLAYDAQHQSGLVLEAHSADEAHQKLAAYRAARDSALGPGGLLTAAYRSLATAATLNDSPSLAAALAAVAQVEAAYKVLASGGAQ